MYWCKVTYMQALMYNFEEFVLYLTISIFLLLYIALHFRQM